MTPDNVCENCGASQPAGTAVCDFCLSALPRREEPAAAAAERPAAKKSSAEASLPGFLKLYGEGKVNEVLGLLAALYKQKPDADQSPDILMLHVKVFLESDGTIGVLKQTIHNAVVHAPDRADVQEYFQLVQAKEKLESTGRDKGEAELRVILKKSPSNAHALLLLGTHFFWTLNRVDEAVRFLESCLKTRPVMLRAWACLGAIHTSRAHYTHAERAFRKCLEYESNPAMITYFKSMLNKRA